MQQFRKCTATHYLQWQTHIRRKWQWNRPCSHSPLALLVQAGGTCKMCAERQSPSSSSWGGDAAWCCWPASRRPVSPCSWSIVVRYNKGVGQQREKRRIAYEHFCIVLLWACVAACCSVLQCVAVCCNVLQGVACVHVLQCVAMCCASACVAVSHSFLRMSTCSSVLQYIALFYSVLQCVAVAMTVSCMRMYLSRIHCTRAHFCCMYFRAQAHI